MSNTIIGQLHSLIIFSITGIAIGIFFDIFRILRKSFRTSNFLTYIEDIIFWIISGIFFMIVLFKFNNGEIRSYVILGLIFGITIYMLTISKYFININVKIIIIIKKILFYPFKLLTSIIRKILKPFSFIVINIRKCFKNLLNLTKK